MTKRTFYRKLREAADKFNWYETRVGLRAYHKSDVKHKRCYCPITAVCKTTTGNYIKNTDVYDAQNLLNFKREADKIIDGADLTCKQVNQRISYLTKEELQEDIRQANYLRKCVGLPNRF